MKPFTYKCTGYHKWTVYFQDSIATEMSGADEQSVYNIVDGLNKAFQMGVDQTMKKYNLTK